VRLRAGKRLSSPAMVADGNHARVDGFVSLGVVASAIVVSLGAEIGDPIIGLLITLVILKILGFVADGLDDGAGRARRAARTLTGCHGLARALAFDLDVSEEGV
jgi:Cation efflux family